MDAEDALAAELGFELGAEKLLELVGFDAENVGMELPKNTSPMPLVAALNASACNPLVEIGRFGCE